MTKQTDRAKEEDLARAKYESVRGLTADLKGLKLQQAKRVEELPDVRRGRKSAIDSLAEFKDLLAIIRAVKEENLPPAEKFQVFDLTEVTKRDPKLRQMRLFRNFGLKARSLMAKQGVDHLLRLEARNKTTYYLVGKRGD